MRSSLFAFPALTLALLSLGSCAGEVAVVPQAARPLPAPAPAPTPAPSPRPAAPAPVLSSDWRDWPLTTGSWSYRQDARGSIALFGRAGADAELTLRCDRTRARIYLSRRGEGEGTLSVSTTSTSRTLNATSAGGTPAYLAVEFGVRDPLLDAIGYSRGRFVVEGGGLPALVIPAWAEMLRVVEDCR